MMGVGQVVSASSEPDRPQLAGVNDVFTLMRALVERPKDVEKFLQAWSVIVEGYDKKIAAVGDISKIGSLKEDAAKALAAAEETRAEAAVELTSAKAEAKRIVDDAKAAAAKLGDEAAKSLAAANARGKQVDEERAALDRDVSARTMEMDARLADLDALAAQLNERQRIIEAKEGKLRAALAEG